MAIEPPEPSPEREKLEELVGHCRKRMARADEKARAAIIEQTEAAHALGGAEERLAQWHIDNPEPQGSLI